MHWAAKYIGVPYVAGGRDLSGVDCWGLIRLIYKEEFGITLAPIPGISVASVLATCSIAERELEESWIEILDPQDGYAVAMSQKDAIHHVGLFADADGGKIIHSWERQNVIADTMRGLRLKGFRTIKFYRHRLWPT